MNSCVSHVSNVGFSVSNPCSFSSSSPFSYLFPEFSPTFRPLAAHSAKSSYRSAVRHDTIRGISRRNKSSWPVGTPDALYPSHCTVPDSQLLSSFSFSSSVFLVPSFVHFFTLVSLFFVRLPPLSTVFILSFYSLLKRSSLSFFPFLCLAKFEVSRLPRVLRLSVRSMQSRTNSTYRGIKLLAVRSSFFIRSRFRYVCCTCVPLSTSV